jgi:hypothetical protein
MYSGKEAVNQLQPSECQKDEEETKDVTPLATSVHSMANLQIKEFSVSYKGYYPGSKHINQATLLIRMGLQQGIAPKLTPEGTSGSYILFGNNNLPVAIFKPSDEEAYAPNNPHNLTGHLGSKSLRKGILSGEAFIREAASYLLSKSYKFSFNIPPTTIAKFVCSEPSSWKSSYKAPLNGQLNCAQIWKIGSLQIFVGHDDCACNYSSDLFDTDEVHKIGILDMRICNTDRNDGNILLKKSDSKFALIPIDHGMSFPSSFEFREEDYCWLSWPQSAQPFSERMKEYIASVNLDKDIESLQCNFPLGEASLIVFKVMNMLLIMAVKRGLTLKDMSLIWCRPSYSEAPSVLETIMQEGSKYRSDLKYNLDTNGCEDVRWLQSKGSIDFFSVIEYRISLEIDKIIRNKPK